MSNPNFSSQTQKVEQKKYPNLNDIFKDLQTAQKKRREIVFDSWKGDIFIDGENYFVSKGYQPAAGFEEIASNLGLFPNDVLDKLKKQGIKIKHVDSEPKRKQKTFEQKSLEIDTAAKLHQGVSTRLNKNLDEFRNLLSKDLIRAFEKSLRDIKKADTVVEAEIVLKTLFDKIHEAALKLTYNEKQKMLDVALIIAKLKERKTLFDIVKKTQIRY